MSLHVPAHARPAYNQAVTAFGAQLAAARRERDEAYVTGGAQAVAALACKSGSDEERARIAETYLSLRDQQLATTATAA